MHTDNLQEMIKADANESMFSNAEGISLNQGVHGKDDFPGGVSESQSPKPKNDPEQTDFLVPHSPEAEMIPQESATEEELIAYTKFLHTRLAISTVQCYWVIGKSILSFYQGKYGTGELRKISEATGIGRDTLTKACKFARQYTEEQVKHILKGKFVLSWFELAQSLTVAPQNLITVYQASSSPGEFHNAIIKLKPPAPKKGKVIFSPVSDRGQAAKDNSDGSQDAEDLFEVHNDHATSPSNEISSPLEAEISDLRATITERDLEIAELQNLLEKSKQDIIIRDDAINSLRRFLGKIRVNLEIKRDHVTLHEMVSKEEWVYEKKFGYMKVSNLGAGQSG